MKRRQEVFRVAVYKTFFAVLCGGGPPGRLPKPGEEPEARFGTEGDYPWLWFRDPSPPPGLVAHECLHAAVWLVQDCCGAPVPVKVANWEETFCYLLEFLVNETVAALGRLRGDRRRRVEGKSR
jgi:hypothetical protein